MQHGWEFHDFIITSADPQLLLQIEAIARREWKRFSKKPLKIDHEETDVGETITFQIEDYSFAEFYSGLKKDLKGYEVIREIGLGYSGTIKAIIRRQVGGPHSDSKTFKALIVKK